MVAWSFILEACSAHWKSDMHSIVLLLALLLPCFNASTLAQGTSAKQAAAPSEDTAAIRLARDKAAAELSDLDKRPFWSANDPDPKTAAGAYFHKGYRFQKARRFHKAVQAYRNAASHDAKLVIAYYNMGLCLEEQQNWAEAEEAFKKVIELSHWMPQGYKHLAFVCFKQGKDGEGRAYVDRLLSL